MKLPMLGADQKLAEIRRLYFSTSRDTIQDDLAKALDLLRSMQSEEERERATVYMHGLNEMRAQWRGKKGGKGGKGRKGGKGGDDRKGGEGLGRRSAKREGGGKGLGRGSAKG